ncbi:hypothetical protein Lal_00004604 [Lupinus albus]|uniref:Putative Late embryogenesis abundant protein, LEA-18 n=1 Tax=Lupinus albus TaxID=3870 RepID=A0A6A4NH87_LUPAL|nr:putative Late embryogenesis abundant protein, LEA-18 [Lupinus albus]KAF1865230.1 hypothetical protein Lal_00004604 [Lupinus albus]
MANNNNEKKMEVKGGSSSEEKGKLEGLGMESSPYVKYNDDLEEYKYNVYGTKGHLQPIPNQGGGTTHAPTLSAPQPQPQPQPN